MAIRRGSPVSKSFSRGHFCCELLSERHATLAVVFCLALLAACPRRATAEEATYRLYDGITAFVNNAEGRDFNVTIDVRDLNHVARGPAELLLKVYDPDGRPVVREVIPDDGVVANTSPPLAGWDHEAWYYATCYSRGLEPLVRWSAFSDPARLNGMAKRTFTRAIKGGAKGIYRVLLVGAPDLYVTLMIDPELPYGTAGGPDWTHGHHDLYKKKFFYVPKGTVQLSLRLLEFDQPGGRVATIKNAAGKVLVSADSSHGMAKGVFPRPTSSEKGAPLPPLGYEDQVLTLEVNSAPGDYLLDVSLAAAREERDWRGQATTFAVLCPDEATARAIQNGAIYHDGQVFWQMYQVRLYDWLKTLPADETVLPAKLAMSNRSYISPGSHQRPKPGTADRIMHDFSAHKNPRALNAAIKEMLEGMRLVGPTDHVMHGRNLAYEMGTYSYFYHRPAWRILQETDAPDEVKACLREFIIQIGDRLAFCRGIELVNGNSLASLLQGLRYCDVAVNDPLLHELFETYWQRFTTGGFGDRFGVGPSGGVQEGYGYDHHYGGYIIRGWHAILADLNDERFRKVHTDVLRLYSYTASVGNNAAPWSSRTAAAPAGGVYEPATPGELRWHGLGGPDMTTSVKGANEFFAARRRNYYVVTYFGRLTPTWLGEGFHGQIGYGGGILCQLHIPGKGQVFASTLHGDYGSGMHPAQWPNFHIHSLVGYTADGRPLVTGNTEMFNARLDGETVTGSGEVRDSSVEVTRSYTFNDADIDCRVRLHESAGNKVFLLYGGEHGLREFVTEAYEMLPLFQEKPRPKKAAKKSAKPAPERPPLNVVTALDGDGKTLGPVTETPTVTAAVLVDRGGFGAKIVLDKPRPVLLGKHNTLLLQIADKSTRVDAVALSYKIVPFEEDAALAGVPVEKPKLARLPAIESLDQVATALAEQPALSIELRRQPMAELRLAVAGDQLAIDAKIVDSAIHRDAVVWKGSCLEVFGSAGARAAVGHVFLAPEAAGAPAAGFLAAGVKIDRMTEIRVQSKPIEKGYELHALVPLKLLALDGAADEAWLEFQLGATPTPNPKLRPKNQPGFDHATLFGSPRAYEDNSHYGRFLIEAK